MSGAADRIERHLGQPLTIAEMQVEAYACAVEKGWWEGDRTFPELIALAHSELSEALEAWRKHAPQAEIAAELADVLIRVGDTAEGMGIDLERAVREKQAFNRTRPHRHGGKRA